MLKLRHLTHRLGRRSILPRDLPHNSPGTEPYRARGKINRGNVDLTTASLVCRKMAMILITVAPEATIGRSSRLRAGEVEMVAVDSVDKT